MDFPRACNICVKEGINAHLFLGNLELALRPLEGANPLVLLVGQDPTIAKGQIYFVLDLDNPNGRLYKYIVSEILKPVGLTLENIYATDLIKCRFPNNQTPKIISKNHGLTIKDFISPFFHNCRRWFFQEVRGIRPRVVLSFGEPTHQMLVEEFGWDVPSKMREAFGCVYKVSLLDNKIFYAPCIHINTKGKAHYRKLWPKFIQNLKEAIILTGII